MDANKTNYNDSRCSCEENVGMRDTPFHDRAHCAPMRSTSGCMPPEWLKYNNENLNLGMCRDSPTKQMEPPSIGTVYNSRFCDEYPQNNERMTIPFKNAPYLYNTYSKPKFSNFIHSRTISSCDYRYQPNGEASAHYEVYEERNIEPGFPSSEILRHMTPKQLFGQRAQSFCHKPLTLVPTLSTHSQAKYEQENKKTNKAHIYHQAISEQFQNDVLCARSKSLPRPRPSTTEFGGYCVPYAVTYVYQPPATSTGGGGNKNKCGEYETIYSYTKSCSLPQRKSRRDSHGGFPDTSAGSCYCGMRKLSETSTVSKKYSDCRPYDHGLSRDDSIAICVGLPQNKQPWRYNSVNVQIPQVPTYPKLNAFGFNSKPQKELVSDKRNMKPKNETHYLKYRENQPPMKPRVPAYARSPVERVKDNIKPIINKPEPTHDGEVPLPYIHSTELVGLEPVSRKFETFSTQVNNGRISDTVIEDKVGASANEESVNEIASNISTQASDPTKNLSTTSPASSKGNLRLPGESLSHRTSPPVSGSVSNVLSPQPSVSEKNLPQQAESSLTPASSTPKPELMDVVSKEKPVSDMQLQKHTYLENRGSGATSDDINVQYSDNQTPILANESGLHSRQPSVDLEDERDVQPVFEGINMPNFKVSVDGQKTESTEESKKSKAIPTEQNKDHSIIIAKPPMPDSGSHDLSYSEMTSDKPSNHVHRQNTLTSEPVVELLVPMLQEISQHEGPMKQTPAIIKHSLDREKSVSITLPQVIIDHPTLKNNKINAKTQPEIKSMKDVVPPRDSSLSPQTKVSSSSTKKDSLPNATLTMVNSTKNKSQKYKQRVGRSKEADIDDGFPPMYTPPITLRSVSSKDEPEAGNYPGIPSGNLIRTYGEVDVKRPPISPDLSLRSADVDAVKHTDKGTRQTIPSIETNETTQAPKKYAFPHDYQTIDMEDEIQGDPSIQGHVSPNSMTSPEIAKMGDEKVLGRLSLLSPERGSTQNKKQMSAGEYMVLTPGDGVYGGNRQPLVKITKDKVDCMGILGEAPAEPLASEVYDSIHAKDFHSGYPGVASIDTNRTSGTSDIDNNLQVRHVVRSSSFIPMSRDDFNRHIYGSPAPIFGGESPTDEFPSGSEEKQFQKSDNRVRSISPKFPKSVAHESSGRNSKSPNSLMACCKRQKTQSDQSNSTEHSNLTLLNLFHKKRQCISPNRKYDGQLSPEPFSTGSNDSHSTLVYSPENSVPYQILSTIECRQVPASELNQLSYFICLAGENRLPVETECYKTALNPFSMIDASYLNKPTIKSPVTSSWSSESHTSSSTGSYTFRPIDHHSISETDAKVLCTVTKLPIQRQQFIAPLNETPSMSETSVCIPLTTNRTGLITCDSPTSSSSPPKVASRSSDFESICEPTCGEKSTRKGTHATSHSISSPSKHTRITGQDSGITIFSIPTGFLKHTSYTSTQPEYHTNKLEILDENVLIQQKLSTDGISSKTELPKAYSWNACPSKDTDLDNVGHRNAYSEFSDLCESKSEHLLANHVQPATVDVVANPSCCTTSSVGFGDLIESENMYCLKTDLVNLSTLVTGLARTQNLTYFTEQTQECQIHPGTLASPFMRIAHIECSIEYLSQCPVLMLTIGQSVIVNRASNEVVKPFQEGRQSEELLGICNIKRYHNQSNTPSSSLYCITSTLAIDNINSLNTKYSDSSTRCIDVNCYWKSSHHPDACKLIRHPITDQCSENESLIVATVYMPLLYISVKGLLGFGNTMVSGFERVAPMTVPSALNANAVQNLSEVKSGSSNRNTDILSTLDYNFLNPHCSIMRTLSRLRLHLPLISQHMINYCYSVGCINSYHNKPGTAVGAAKVFTNSEPRLQRDRVINSEKLRCERYCTKKSNQYIGCERDAIRKKPVIKKPSLPLTYNKTPLKQYTRSSLPATGTGNTEISKSASNGRSQLTQSVLGFHDGGKEISGSLDGTSPTIFTPSPSCSLGLSLDSMHGRTSDEMSRKEEVVYCNDLCISSNEVSLSGRDEQTITNSHHLPPNTQYNKHNASGMENLYTRQTELENTDCKTDKSILGRTSIQSEYVRRQSYRGIYASYDKIHTYPTFSKSYSGTNYFNNRKHENNKNYSTNKLGKNINSAFLSCQNAHMVSAVNHCRNGSLPRSCNYTGRDIYPEHSVETLLDSGSAYLPTFSQSSGFGSAADSDNWVTSPSKIETNAEYTDGPSSTNIPHSETTLTKDEFAYPHDNLQSSLASGEVYVISACPEEENQIMQGKHIGDIRDHFNAHDNRVYQINNLKDKFPFRHMQMCSTTGDVTVNRIKLNLREMLSRKRDKSHDMGQTIWRVYGQNKNSYKQHHVNQNFSQKPSTSIDLHFDKQAIFVRGEQYTNIYLQDMQNVYDYQYSDKSVDHAIAYDPFTQKAPLKQDHLTQRHMHYTPSRHGTVRQMVFNSNKVTPEAQEILMTIRETVHMIMEDLKALDTQIIERNFRTCEAISEHLVSLPNALTALLDHLHYSPIEYDLVNIATGLNRLINEIVSDPVVVLFHLVELGYRLQELANFFSEDLLPEELPKVVHSIQSKLYRMKVGFVVRQYLHIPQTSDFLVTPYSKSRQLLRLEEDCGCRVNLIHPEDSRATYCPHGYRTIEVVYDEETGRSDLFCRKLNYIINPRRETIRLVTTIVRQINGQEFSMNAEEVNELLKCQVRPRYIDIKSIILSAGKHKDGMRHNQFM